MRYPSGKTHLWAIIGDPVAHVRAPYFFNPIFEERGLDAFLLALHVPKAELTDIVPRLARIPNLKGLIVTIPHKVEMAKLVHELGPNGKLCGAVNTIRLGPDGHMAGDMFDGLGLVAGMRSEGIEPRGKRILLIGAGGANRAIAFALAAEDVTEIGIWNRTLTRAAELAAEVQQAFPACPVRVAPADARDFDIVVNGTSLGMHEGDPLPMDPSSLTADKSLVDIIAVRDTELMQAARGRGCKVMGGKPMAVLQIDSQLAFIGTPPKVG